MCAHTVIRRVGDHMVKLHLPQVLRQRCQITAGHRQISIVFSPVSLTQISIGWLQLDPLQKKTRNATE